MGVEAVRDWKRQPPRCRDLLGNQKAIAVQARPIERRRELATVVPLPLETSSKVTDCSQGSPQYPEPLGETTNCSLVDGTSGADSGQAFMGWNLLKSLPGGPG